MVKLHQTLAPTQSAVTANSLTGFLAFSLKAASFWPMKPEVLDPHWAGVKPRRTKVCLVCLFSANQLGVIWTTQNWCGASSERWSKIPKRVPSHLNHLFFFKLSSLLWHLQSSSRQFKGPPFSFPPPVEWEGVWRIVSNFPVRFSSKCPHVTLTRLWTSKLTQHKHKHASQAPLQTWCQHLLNSTTSSDGLAKRQLCNNYCNSVSFLLTPHGIKSRFVRL